MRTSPSPAQSPPSWPHCGHGAAPATDAIGCPGIHVPSYTACLAHLDDTDRDAYLASLTPGADIDHRGTSFTEELLAALLHALHDPTTRTACFGAARFEQAQFSGAARFKRARFSGGARFELAEFSGVAHFELAQFSGVAQFNGAQFSNLAHFGEAEFSRTAEFAWVKFSGGAWFGEAKFSAGGQFGDAQFFDTAYFPRTQFSGDAWFSGARFFGAAQFQGAEFSNGAVFEQAQFSGDGQFERTEFSRTAWFAGARFSGAARFERAKFSDTAGFAGAQFASDALFGRAWFTVMSSFGPVVCAKEVDLSGAVFEAPVTLEIAARQVRCERTRWESTATLRLRYASVNLDHAALSFPVAVTAHPVPFTTSVDTATAVQESSLAGHNDGVRVVSVRGVDAAHLMLTDTDLSDCLFSGAFHLDQLRLEGRCTFALTPQGLHFRRRIWPYWWSRRRTLAEEHHWRALTSGQPIPPAGQDPSPRHWRTGPHHPNPDQTPDPEDVAALYRQLRKAFEDGKNEPGAADFYYGEMEMRRHQPSLQWLRSRSPQEDRTGISRSEWALLRVYWLLSGYGLRASRAIAGLLTAMAVTVLLIMGLGLPDTSPKQVATGTVPADGGRVTLAVDKEDPQLTLPVADRFTTERFDKSLQVVLNSVVFRSSGQDLTTAGTYTEMISRFTEPVLLALAILAMRSRIKR